MTEIKESIKDNEFLLGISHNLDWENDPFNKHQLIEELIEE